MRQLLTTIILTLLPFCCATAATETQPTYQQRTFTVHDGLPSNAITAIRQDHRGLVWIATWHGLCCYDGYRFTTFPGDDWDSDNALTTRRISIVEPDSRDNVWVRAYDGTLYLFDTRECRYHNMTEALRRKYGQAPLPRNIYCLQTGHTWISDENRQMNLRIDDRYPTDADRIEVIEQKALYGDFIRKVETDQQGREWVITDRGMMRYGSQEVRQGVFSNYPDGQDGQHRYDQLFPAIEKRMTDQQGNLWFSSPSGLTLVNFVDHPMRLLPVEPTKPTRSVVCRRDGTIWAGSAGGNIVVYGSDGRPKGWLTPQGSISSSPARFSAYIYALYEDRHGNLWIGTRGHGIYRLAANGNAVGHYQHNLGDPYSLSHDIVYDFDEDEQGRLWVATYGGGVNLVKDADSSTPRFLHRGNEMTQYPKEAFEKVRRITHDGRGTILASTTNGLLTFASEWQDPQQLRFHTTRQTMGDTTSLRTADVMQVLVCRDRRIYVATMGGGIQQIASNDLLQDGLQLRSVAAMNGGAGNVLSMTEDRQGCIWISRESETDRYDGRTGQLEQFGASSMDEQTVLTEAKPAVDQQGRLWMGATGGVLCFAPEQMRKSSFRPPIVYTSYQFQGDQEAHSILNREVLTIERSEQRNLTVSFAALDYTDNYLMQYAYRIKESGEGWNYIGREPHVAFSQLSAGRHTLVVKSTNGDGVWTDNEAELIIDVRPTLMERTWVRGLLLLLVIGLTTLAVVTWLSHRRKMQEREQRLDHILRQYNELQAKIDTQGEAAKTERREYRLEEPQIVNADEEMMNRLMAFVEKRLSDENLKIDEMAEAVGLGRTVFYEKIRELVGVSPSDFLKQVRMQRACQLLAKSRLSVAEVAYAIGFTDPKYFTKCFKKDTGMTPTEYRTSKQNQQ